MNLNFFMNFSEAAKIGRKNEKCSRRGAVFRRTSCRGAIFRDGMLFFSENDAIFVHPIRKARPARMAESVDALVSNTNDSNVVPVRPRLRVHSESLTVNQLTC